MYPSLILWHTALVPAFTRQKQNSLCEFEAKVFYLVNFRPTRDTQGDSVSKQKQKTQQKWYKLDDDSLWRMSLRVNFMYTFYWSLMSNTGSCGSSMGYEERIHTVQNFSYVHQNCFNIACKWIKHRVRRAARWCVMTSDFPIVCINITVTSSRPSCELTYPTG
jgi:hypothetical protein